MATICICLWTLGHSWVHSVGSFCALWPFTMTHARWDSVKPHIFFYLTIFSSAFLCLTFTILCIFIHVCIYTCMQSKNKHSSSRNAWKQAESGQISPRYSTLQATTEQVLWKTLLFPAETFKLVLVLQSSMGAHLPHYQVSLQPWQGTISWSRRLASGTEKLVPSKNFKLLF